MVRDSLVVGTTAVLGALLCARPASAWGPSPAAVAVSPAAPAPEATPVAPAPEATPRALAPGVEPAGPAAEPETDTGEEDAAESRAEADAALKRVLASGCRDGLADLYGLIGHADAPWAETVMRLCGEVLRRVPRPRPHLVAAEKPRAAPARDATRDGRGQLVFWSGLYGAWLGVATDVLFEVGGRTLILPPMVGMAAGLTVSLVLTERRHVTGGEAWTIITGLDYGSVNGALWADGLGFGTKGVVGTAVATSFAAAAAGLAVADARSPSAGQIELCRSGLLWGTVAGFLAVTAFAPEPGPSGRTTSLASALAMDAGFVGGLAVARKVDVSRSRALIIDAGAFVGTLLGVGVAWMAVGVTSGHRTAIAGGGLAGLAGGVVVATLATRKVDAAPDPWAAGAPSFPALVARDGDGRWHAGAPAPTPVLDPTGARLAGAALNAVGGLF
jgi:hypothetical protein